MGQVFSLSVMEMIVMMLTVRDSDSHNITKKEKLAEQFPCMKDY